MNPSGSSYEKWKTSLPVTTVKLPRLRRFSGLSLTGMGIAIALQTYLVLKLKRRHRMDLELKNALIVERTVLEARVANYALSCEGYTNRISQLESMIDHIRNKMEECRNEVRLINEQLKGKGASNGV